MDQKLYLSYRKQLKSAPIAAYKGYLHVCVFFALTLLGIFFATKANVGLYLLGEIFLILSFLNGQILLHELGHGFFIRHRKMNHFFGHIIALSPIIPYRPWVLIHGQHHRWSGNKFKDPTMIPRSYEELTDGEKKFINFCWKFWIPVFGLSYSLRAFWNVSKLKRLFPDHMRGISLSMLAPIALYSTLFFLFPMAMLKIWLPAYYLFMAVAEPLLFSQHVHVDQADSRDAEFTHESSYHVTQQDVFSRNLVFPQWFTKWILLGFNQHAIHHIFPNLPGYEYSQIKETFPNTMDWKQWYAISKSTDAATLLFKSNGETHLVKGQV